MRKKIIVAYIISFFCVTPIVNSWSYDETDPYYNAGRGLGMLLGTLYERNRTPHINIHDEFTYVASNGTSAFYLDLDSAKSLKNTSNLKVARGTNMIVDYANNKIWRYSITYVFDLNNFSSQFSINKMDVFDLDGKLIVAELDVDDKMQPVVVPSAYASTANTIYNKLYGTAFYPDPSIPILVKKQKLMD